MDPHRHAGPDRRRRRRGPRRAARPLSGLVPGCARLEVDRERAELASDVLWFAGATAVGERDLPGGRVELEAGFVTTDAAAAAAAVVAERLPDVAVELVDVGPALEAALDAWKAHARPVRAGHVHVRPPWLAADDDPPAAGERCVVIDPGRAFGSGSHPSTVACLEAVADLIVPGASVLDVGCGSGVLAVAAAVLGASPVVAIDIDPVAVDATLRNAAANSVAVHAATTDVAAVDGRFDVVLANIGAATLVRLAPSLVERVAAGGHLVLSGLLVAQADAVTRAHAGLVEVGRSPGPWATVRLQRPIHQNHDSMS